MKAAIVGVDVSATRAREAFIAYRTLVRAGRGTEDDEVLMRSYRAIAQGRKVLDLRETLKQAGLDEKFRPRLAISRADQTHVVFMHSNTWCYSSPLPRRATRPSFCDGSAIAVRSGIYPALDNRSSLPDVAGERTYRFSLRAAVPPIPAQFRPQESLHLFHILWDVVWDPVPPTDPILLGPNGGFLDAVGGQGGLTDLERAVLGARL